MSTIMVTIMATIMANLVQSCMPKGGAFFVILIADLYLFAFFLALLTACLQKLIANLSVLLHLQRAFSSFAPELITHEMQVVVAAERDGEEGGFAFFLLSGSRRRGLLS